MFSRLTVVGDGSVGSLTIQLGDVSSGINIVDINGLDPVKATLTSTNLASQAGAIFQNARRETRNITMKLEIKSPDASTSVRSIRNNIFKIFREGTQILMKFYVDDDDLPVSDGYQIIGYVENCNSSMFSQTPTVDISIICYDPDFYDPEIVTVTGMTTADVSATPVSYPGTVETGITFTVNINRAISEFWIYYVDGDGVSWTMDVAAVFQIGDVVTIETTPGNRSISLLRAGVTTSILYAISPQSTWPLLSPGDNSIQFVASGAGIPASIAYKKLYSAV